MKAECSNCTHLKNNVCIKNSKNGYFNCQKFKQIPITELIKERQKLLISGEDSERLEFLTNKITEINGGIL